MTRRISINLFVCMLALILSGTTLAARELPREAPASQRLADSSLAKEDEEEKAGEEEPKEDKAEEPPAKEEPEEGEEENPPKNPAHEGPFDPIGRFELQHTDGSTFHAELFEDHSASSDFGQGEKGHWRWDGSRLNVTWTDGWRDLIFLDPQGSLTKWGWGPGADRNGPPTNKGPARKLQ